MRLQCCVPVPRPRLLGMVLVLAVFSLAQPALANPLPGGVVLVNVQPPDPAICSEGTITECAGITQYTTETGMLEFTLFVYTYFLPEGITGVETTIEWPAEWQFIEGDLCGASDGTFAVNANTADIASYFVSADPSVFVFPFARLVFDVSGEGQLIGVGDCMMRWGLPPDEGWEYIWVEPGQAGCQCSYTYMTCDFESPCRPQMDPEQLMFELPEGESSQQMIHAHSAYAPQCWSQFDTIGDWLSIEVEEVGSNEWDIVVTADASGLAMGEYVGWVRGEAEAPRCSEVTLYVTAGAQDVPECWGPDDAAPATWGAIKSLYR